MTNEDFNHEVVCLLEDGWDVEAIADELGATVDQVEEAITEEYAN